MATSIREAAEEIGRTTQFRTKDAMIAAALIAEDYPDQDDAVGVLKSFVEIALVQRRSLPAVAVDMLPVLRGEVFAA